MSFRQSFPTMSLASLGGSVLIIGVFTVLAEIVIPGMSILLLPFLLLVGGVFLILLLFMGLTQLHSMEEGFESPEDMIIAVNHNKIETQNTTPDFSTCKVCDKQIFNAFSCKVCGQSLCGTHILSGYHECGEKPKITQSVSSYQLNSIQTAVIEP